MLFNKIILIIVSLSLVATINGQSIGCPQIWWWPLSNSVSFLTEVMKGNNIISVNSITFVNDRISFPSNLNGVYIKGGNIFTSSPAAYISFLTLPTDTYFCTTATTITFWIYTTQTPAVGTIARIIDFSDASPKSSGIALFIKPAPNNFINAAVGLELATGFGSTQSVSDQFTGFAPQTWTHVAVSFSSTGSSIAINIFYNGFIAFTASPGLFLPSTCPLMTSNFIGKGTSPNPSDVNLDAYLNDIKLFNTSLTATQVQALYTGEKCNIYLVFLIYFVYLFNLNYI
jgi:hypothetical protein